jgi:predicted negative regulator of RcsB-dependent stress response
VSKGDREKALPLYEKVANAGNVPVSVRGRAGLNATLVLMGKSDFSECGKKGAAFAEKTKGTYYEAGLWSTVAFCAMEDKNDALIKKCVARIEASLANPEVGLNTDDRSDLYDALSSGYQALGDEASSKLAVKSRIEMLEQAAKTAPSPLAAQTFDAHSTEIYIAQARFDDAIAMLQASENASPKDYNPPARLARVYLAKRELQAAKSAIGRARARVYGPRTASLAILQGDIEAASGDKDAAKKAYEDAKAVLKAQPPTLGTQRRLQQIDKALADLRL